MDVLYSSTRGNGKAVKASEAILQGLAEDGGLFVPDHIPVLDKSLKELSGMTYQEVAYEVMKLFLTDFTEEELKNCINRAYDDKFDTEVIAPLVEAEGAYYLELFHGSTIAFKDMALSILPHLMITSARKNIFPRYRDLNSYIRGYRKGGLGRLCKCRRNQNSGILSQERSQPHPGKADGDTDWGQYLCGGHPWQL